MAEAHSAHTEEVLGSSPVFTPVRELASSAHERSDYHCRGRSSDLSSSIVAAADVFAALTHDRPWRQAWSEAAAAEELLSLADSRQIEREAVRGVLAAAGHGKRVTDRAYPNGITAREAEVLRELARGKTNKEIAAALGMAPKTADNHIQNLYRKIKGQSRTAAAMYALEHGIFTP